MANVICYSTQPLPPFVLNWTTPSALIQTKRYKVKRIVERPEVLLPFPTLFHGFSPPPSFTHILDPFPNEDATAYLRSTFPTVPRWPVSEHDDVWLSPPPYTDKWVITVVPHGTATEAVGKAVVAKYNEHDVYKCFLKSLMDGGCAGAWLCLPLSLFLGLNGTGVRLHLFSQYRVVAVNQFHGHVLRYDACSYVAVCIHRSPEPLLTQSILWSLAHERQSLPIQRADDWVCCADLYRVPRRPTLKVTRLLSHSPVAPETHVTHLVLQAIDGGAVNARIRMRVDPHKQYGDAASKNLTTLCVKGVVLTMAQQEQVAERWTLLVEELRQERWGLFLSPLDDQITYSRKRIGYKLAFILTEHVISKMLDEM